MKLGVEMGPVVDGLDYLLHQVFSITDVFCSPSRIHCSPRQLLGPIESGRQGALANKGERTTSSSQYNRVDLVLYNTQLYV